MTQRFGTSRCRQYPTMPRQGIGQGLRFTGRAENFRGMYESLRLFRRYLGGDV